MVSTHAYLFVGVESHADVAVRNLLVVAQVAHGLHDFGNACLVVGTEQRCSVGHNQVFSLVLQQFRELGRTADDAFRQLNVASVVVSHDSGFDVLARAVGAGIVVGNESDGGNRLGKVRLQRGIDVPFVVHLHVVEALLYQFFFQELGKKELFRCTRYALRILARLRIKLHIVQKSFSDVHG